MELSTHSDSGLTTAPLSSAQRRLWFLHRLRPDSEAYNIAFSYRLRGDLDTERLRESLAVVVARHDALRTYILERDGDPMQVIVDSMVVRLPVEDLSRVPAPERDAQVHERVDRQHQTPFDLTCGPLFRFGLIKLDHREYVLSTCFHHVIADGWSMEILFREVAVAYRTSRDGRSPNLPVVHAQYREYVAAQIARRDDPRTDSDIEYWRRKLDAVSPLELPTDRARPADKSHRGRVSEFAIPAPVFAGVETLGRTRRTTPFITWLAILQVFLHRYSGQTDVVVGTPIAGRDQWEFESTIGLFVDTLVLRSDLSGNPSFSEFLDRVHVQTIEAYDHQGVPFGTLVEVLNPPRAMNRSPFFDVLLNIRDAELSPNLPGIDAVIFETQRTGAKFDLTFSIKPARSSVEIEYDTDLFDGETIARIGADFTTLVTDISVAPQRRVGDLRLVGAAQREKMLINWNATDRPPPGVPAVYHWFARWVADQPGRPCVVSGAEVLTYAELDARASRLAQRLRRRGVGAHRIGVYLGPGTELVVAVLGVLKAGAAYVPLDTRMPRTRLEYILTETGAPVVLTTEVLSREVAGLGADVIALDNDAELLSCPASDPAVTMRPDDLMYVLYTSGSTGRPKGVEIEHRQVINYLDAVIHRLELGAGWSYAMVQPLAVDSSVTTLFPPLCTGGVLHLLADDTVLDPSAMAAYFAEHTIDVLKIAPGHLAALQADGRAPLMPRRCLVIGGESCPEDWVHQLVKAHPQVAIHNHYGPTEATVGILTHRIGPHGSPDKPVPLGRPLANTKIYILDGYSNPVPVGVDGELCVQGRCLARGYLHRPDLTAEVFVENPLPEADGQRMYRTGDRARYRPDGTIEFRGRVDQQVKIRGFRVEPGEIERALVAHSAVRETAVVCHRPGPEDATLFAFVVAGDAPPTPEDLQAHVARRLPDYMVPRCFVFCAELPRTRHGKLDVSALRAAAGDTHIPSGAEFVAPEAGTERRLAEIWSSELKAPVVGARDNFFDLGGHSLLVIKILAWITREWGVRIPVRTLFEKPTVSELAAEIDRRLTDDPEPPSLSPIRRQPRALR